MSVDSLRDVNHVPDYSPKGRTKVRAADARTRPTHRLATASPDKEPYQVRNIGLFSSILLACSD